MNTFDTARLLIAALQPTERSRLLQEIAPATATPVTAQRLIRPAEAARLLARSTRSIHHLAAQGVLHRVTLPGRKRGAGFREADVLALIR
jgi:hypothetical protein